MISIKMLQSALKSLPRPQHRDQVYQLRVMNRIDELNALYCPIAEIKNEAISYQTVNMRVAKYCISENDCWLEWELDL